MRHLLAMAACAASMGACAPTQPAEAPAPAVAQRVRVESVTDGDTFRTTDGERVRLLQVDAPELQQGECHAREARAALVELLEGASVELRADPDLDGRDRFGRLLRYVHADDELVNLALVEQGAAAPYFYRGERGRHARQLLRAARTARRIGRGAWGSCPRAYLDPTRAWQTSTSA